MNPGNLLLCFLDGSGRIPEPHAAGNTFGNSALRGDHAAVSNLNVADDSDLSRHRHALAHTGAPGDTGLRHNDGIFPDHHVVRDLHEIIDLHALLDPRPAKPCAINRRVRSDLNIIVNLDDTELLNLLLPAVDHFKTEAVSANHRAAMNDHA